MRVTLLKVRHLAGEELDVGAAHPDAFDVDDHLLAVSAWRFDVVDRPTTRTGHDEGAHQRIALVTSPVVGAITDPGWSAGPDDGKR
jgi:hypothetical protein